MFYGELEAFLCGMVAGMILTCAFGWIAYGWVRRDRRRNPYAEKMH